MRAEAAPAAQQRRAELSQKPGLGSLAAGGCARDFQPLFHQTAGHTSSKKASKFIQSNISHLIDENNNEKNIRERAQGLALKDTLKFKDKVYFVTSSKAPRAPIAFLHSSPPMPDAELSALEHNPRLHL